MLPVLLRILLSLSLVLNGSAYAVAGTQMQMGSMDTAASPAMAGHRMAMAQSPCQQMPADSSATASADAAQDPAPATLPARDCSQAGMCSYACAQPAPAAAPAAGLRLAAVPHAQVASPARAAHVAPILQNLIRPPIG